MNEENYLERNPTSVNIREFTHDKGHMSVLNVVVSLLDTLVY